MWTRARDAGDGNLELRDESGIVSPSRSGKENHAPIAPMDEVREGFKRSECGAIDRDNEARIARNREIQKEWQAWER
jgi:hypothetical protein